jgi:uncharacterized protein YjbI with pentapeptide repeats
MALDILLVDANIGYGFSTYQQQALQRGIQEELGKIDRAGRPPHDATELQAYLDQVSRLLLEDGLRDSDVDSGVQQLARARTLATLSDLNAEDNRSVTRFLTDMDLAKDSDSVKLLRQADLSGADLGGAYLPAAGLDTSSLRGTNLRGALLTSANLGGAVLIGANLEGANLQYADLESAELAGATLKDADLTQANLSHAKVTDGQLRACESLEGATMPDGSTHP